MSHHSKEAFGHFIPKDHSAEHGANKRRREEQLARKRAQSHNGNGESLIPRELTQFSASQLRAIDQARNGGKDPLESKTNYRARIAQNLGITPDRLSHGITTLRHLATNQIGLDAIVGVRLMTNPQNPDEIRFEPRMKPILPNQPQPGHPNGRA